MRNVPIFVASLILLLTSAIGADAPKSSNPHYSTEFQPQGSREWNSDDSKAAFKCDESMGRRMTDLVAAGNPLAQAVASGSHEGAEFWGAMMEGCLVAMGRTDIKGFVVQDDK